MTHAVVGGERENGKSTLTAHMARKVPARVVFDHRGDFRAHAAGVARTYDGLQLGMSALADGEISELAYSPAGDLDEAFEDFAHEVKRWILERPTQPLAIVVDDVKFCPIATSDFQWSMKCCKRHAIHFFLSGHRPSDIAPDLQSVVDQWFLFQVSQPHDVKYLRALVSPDVLARVQRLGPKQFIQWRRDRTWEMHDNPRLWYVPLGTPGAAVIPLDAVARASA